MRNFLMVTLLMLTIPATLTADVCKRMEAEDFSRIDGSFELVYDVFQGGDRTSVGAPNGSASQGDSYVTYLFRPDVSGSYCFRARVLAPTGADDSFCVRITDAAGSVLSPSTAGQCGGDTYWDFWANPNPQIFELRNGWNTWPPSAQQVVCLDLTANQEYSFMLRRREDGVFIDWLEYCRKTNQEINPDTVEYEHSFDKPN